LNENDALNAVYCILVDAKSMLERPKPPNTSPVYIHAPKSNIAILTCDASAVFTASRGGKDQKTNDFPTSWL